MSRRANSWIVALMLCGLFSGCGLMQSAKQATADSMKMMRPRGNDYRNTSDESSDEWTSMGGASRSLRAGQSENDPLRKFLLSPKAQSIEHNLGVDE